ncbi:HupE/UreJ family protein [Riemerella columbina]|uniref:HupE/UreJ family protein n=1 Tax=Riemerella columbina TaxID=103810 RepID=UPI0003635E41|nr:HupE/UreJ family protein [Riemerella columbina]
MDDFLFYLNLGWEHIISMDALDHQLFILALVAVYTFRDLKKLLVLVTAFTIGHSLTLALSSLDIIRFSTAWIEFLIPCTIVITAFDNIIMKNKPQKLVTINYILALFFGFIHGMGFANSVRIMLAKEQSIFVPLLGFNIGLELGQIVAVIIIMLIYLIATSILRVPRRDWIMFTSSAVFALALQMALERLPF